MQVIYFHNPQYTKIPRLSLARFNDVDASPVHVLPALWQLYPDIKIAYEEQEMDITQKRKRWTWLVYAGRIYLLAPDATIYFHPNARFLIAPYMKWRTENERSAGENVTVQQYPSQQVQVARPPCHPRPRPKNRFQKFYSQQMQK